MRIERLRVHDLELEALRGGSGPLVLVLHGPTSLNVETPFLGLLAEHAEIVAPAHPGFGGSPRPDDVDSVYDLVRVYQSVLDSLPREKVTLIGLSFGGWLAAEVAINYGHKLDQLILVDPVGIKVGGREERDIVHLFNTSPAEVQRLGWHDPTKQRPGLGGVGWQQQIEAMSDEHLTIAARDWDALCLYAWRPHLYNPKLARWLHRITVPTLLLWGESDRIVAPGYAEAYHRLVPGSRLEIVPEAGHHPELEQPEAFVKQVVRFMREG
jgi:pimeloyl-ACP methyl ester carboxylesterase